MSAHPPSQVRLALSCMAFFECDLEEEEEGEFRLELGRVSVVRTVVRRARNGLLS